MIKNCHQKNKVENMTQSNSSQKCTSVVLGFFIYSFRLVPSVALLYTGCAQKTRLKHLRFLLTNLQGKQH